MIKTCGAPPKLTRAQVRELLEWHARRREFSKKFGTTDQLAGRLGVSKSIVVNALSFIELDPSTATERRRSKRTGRPYILSDSQFAEVELYAAARRQLRAVDGSWRQKAKELKVSLHTVESYIKRPERYFKEDRPANAPVPLERKSRTAGPANASTPPKRPKVTGLPRSRPSLDVRRLDSENAQRSALLRSWPGKNSIAD